MLLAIGVFNDILSLWLMYSGHSNSANGNIYVLIDMVLIFWLIKLLSKTRTNYFLIIIMILGIAIWILDNLILHTVYQNNSLFRMCASAFIVVICLEKLGDITLFNGPDRVIRTEVLILAGLLAYYGFKTFIECFHVFQMHVSKSFYISFWVILAMIRIITYILFSLAILWAPKRTEFITHL